jgi:anti-anti-sigma regulatory factor
MRGETLDDAQEGWRAFHAISQDLGKASGPEAHFKLLNPQPLVKKVLDTAGFTTIMTIFEDEETAVASFS